MKKVISLLAISLSATFAMAQGEQTLMTVNGKAVTKSFFEYINGKNNSTAFSEKKTTEEYLELFKIFRLKVAEAEAQGLDTVSSFVDELRGYRNQLAAPYLTDAATKDALIKQEYERMKEDVDVSHILIKIEGKKTPADTLAAYKKALDIISRLKKEPFEKLAKEFSIDPSVKQNGGHLGFLSALWTVYPFEDAAYSLAVGQVSKPVQTSFGYHILKINARRAAQGKIQVAHIMRFTNDTIPGKNEKAEKEIQAIYARVKAGEDFGTLAKQNSEDSYSAQNNGELPWFDSGKMVKEFEETAYALKAKGDISAPIKTQFGWHIIKLLDRKGIDSFDQAKAEIERQISMGDRSQLVSKAFVDRLKKEYNYQDNKTTLKEMEKVSVKSLGNDSLFYLAYTKINKPLFSFAGKNYNTWQFCSYLEKQKLPCVWIERSLEQYVAQEIKAYEDSQLENKYPDFRNLMQEYRDGILLFNISNKEVWEKASTDSLGLRNYFNINSANYKWAEPRFKGRVISCRDKKTADKVKLILKKEKADSIDVRLSALNKKDSVIVKSEKNLFVKGSHAAVDFYAFKTGNFKPVNDFKVVFVDGKVLNAPESYLDVKGLITQDYQNYLEQSWIKALQAKYPIEMNSEALKTLK